MHKARFQRDGKALALSAELRTLGLAVIAYPNFTEVLHIVHIHSHHMPQSVRIEQRMGTFAHRIFGIALHQAQLFQPFHHHLGGKLVHLHIRNARTEGFDRLKCMAFWIS